MIIESIIMYLGVLAWDVISDYRKWLKRKTVKHKLEWVLRVALLLPSAIGFAGELTNTYFIIGLFFSYMLLGSVWWLVFDLSYNKLRGFGWWFNGSAELNKDRSWLDDMLTRLKDWQEALIKFSFIGIMLLIYFKLLP